MIRWSHLTALSLVVCIAASPARAVETHEMIPADALGGVACKSIQGLVKKSEKLLKDAEIKVPDEAQPATLCKQLFMALGIQTGLDTKAGCSLVAVNKKHVGAEVGFRNFDQFLVMSIPFTNLDDMAKNFGFDKGKLKPETITAIEKERDFGKICYVKGKYIYLGANEKAILSVAKGKSVGEELNDAQRKKLAEADCLCHLGTQVWGDFWKQGLRDTENAFEHIKDEAERKTVREFVQSLAAVRHVFCTCRIDEGVGCGCMCVFPRDVNDTVKKFLQALRGGDGNSTLKGLPEGNVVAATAIHGVGAKNNHIMKMFFDLLHRDIFETNHIFGAADRPAVMAVFNEIWPHLKGSRLALYKTADERKLGLFSIMSILDVEDSDRFLAQLKLLVKLGSAEGLDLTSEAGKEKTEAEIKKLIEDLGARRFQVRDSATSKLLLAGEQVLPYLEQALKSMDLETKRRAERIKNEIVQAAETRRKELLSGDLTRAVKPSFVFLDKMEKVEGFEVYNVGVKLKKADLATAPQLKQLLGPDWNRVRLAVQGKQIVVLAGSDVKLLGEALRNLKDGKPGLASAAALGEQSKKIDTGRKIEFHLSMALAAALATAADLEKPGKIPANPPLTTAALTVEEDRLQCECWLPLAEIKAIAKTVQEQR